MVLNWRNVWTYKIISIDKNIIDFDVFVILLFLSGTFRLYNKSKRNVWDDNKQTNIKKTFQSSKVKRKKNINKRFD